MKERGRAVDRLWNSVEKRRNPRRRPNFSADENLHIELFPGAVFGYNEKKVNAHGGGEGVCAIFSGGDGAGTSGCQNHALCPDIPILPERRRPIRRCGRKNEGPAASTLSEIGEKNSFGAPKRRRNAAFFATVTGLIGALGGG